MILLSLMTGGLQLCTPMNNIISLLAKPDDWMIKLKDLDRNVAGRYLCRVYF